MILIVIFLLCNSFVPLKELQSYPYDPDPDLAEWVTITSDDIKYYMENRSQTDTMYSLYLDLSRRELSLFDAAWSLLLPDEKSPFFIYDSKTGTYILRNACNKQSYVIDKYVHTWIDFIISYSRTYEMKGYGPTIILEGGGRKSEINYSQLLAALTWYKLNSKYLSPDAFLFYSGSINGEEWVIKAYDWFCYKEITEHLQVEIPRDLLSAIFCEEEKMRDSLFHSIDIFPIFRIYNTPETDKQKYTDYQKSFVTAAGYSYDLQYF